MTCDLSMIRMLFQNYEWLQIFNDRLVFGTIKSSLSTNFMNHREVFLNIPCKTGLS